MAGVRPQGMLKLPSQIDVNQDSGFLERTASVFWRVSMGFWSSSFCEDSECLCCSIAALSPALIEFMAYNQHV